MKKQFIAMVLSSALAATSLTATPARADEDVFKVLGGLVVLGILANQIEKNKERNVARQPARNSTVYTQRIGPPVTRRAAKLAPSRCVREQWTHRGTREVYGARCMQSHAKAQLPQNCLRQNKTNSGPRYFYAPRCLRQNGWRL
ncbi:MAG: hypothetical protein AAF340_16100 [Pseudomonadota bacterium]